MVDDEVCSVDGEGEVACGDSGGGCDSVDLGLDDEGLEAFLNVEESNTVVVDLGEVVSGSESGSLVVVGGDGASDVGEGDLRVDVAESSGEVDEDS